MEHETELNVEAKTDKLKTVNLWRWDRIFFMIYLQVDSVTELKSFEQSTQEGRFGPG